MNPIRTLSMAALLLVCASVAFAAVKTQEIEYTVDGTALQGFMAWDDAKTGKRPGILVVHEWWGHNQHARNAAEKLAKAGYVAFALDMFGKGKVTTHPSEAQAFVAEATKDPALAKARFDAGRVQLLKSPYVDPERIGAIGYCFGGGVALAKTRFDAARVQLLKSPYVDPQRIGAIGYCFGGAVVLARASEGEDLDAVATFHAALGNGEPVEKGKVKARLLVMTGADDPMVTADAVAAFQKQMKDAGAHLTVIRFPGARHGFTNPDADKAGLEGLAYNADADKKSWAEALKLFKETWK